MNFVPSRTSGFACQMHFFVVDTIHAIDSRCVEQYSAVKMSLDVSYCRVFCWDNVLNSDQQARRLGEMSKPSQAFGQQASQLVL